MLCAVGDGEGFHFDIAGEGGAFFQGEFTPAGDVTSDEAVNGAFVRLDGGEEFDFGAAFDEEALADDVSAYFSVPTHGEVAGAFDISGEFAFDGEVMTLDGFAGDDALFVDEDVAAGLDTAGVDGLDVMALEGDHAATFPALSGVREGVGEVTISALEADGEALFLADGLGAAAGEFLEEALRFRGGLWCRGNRGRGGFWGWNRDWDVGRCLGGFGGLRDWRFL